MLTRIRPHLTRFWLLIMFVVGGVLPTAAQTTPSIPAPRDVLGFTPGDSRKLASWQTTVDYFRRLDAASDRVIFEELGRSTMDNPFVAAYISSPANLRAIDKYKDIQRRLADPRTLGKTPSQRDKAAQALIRQGKTIVLITCGIHSTEVGSYLSSMLIAHRLASNNDAATRKILDNTIILLVPSLNPDGVDIVKNWYDKTLDTPYEGTSPPTLYHKYVGHDNNRDWYAFTQKETQITVDKLHNTWHPQIVHDIHQQGAFGARLFLPPYMKPVEPNVPAEIIEGYTELGTSMFGAMRAKGYKGLTINSTYDAWTPARAYSHYHGGVRILSETASARLASPITVKYEDLREDDNAGFDPQKSSANFPEVWQGGEWTLRDITNYMTTAAFALLDHAATNREAWLGRFYKIGSDAVRERKPDFTNTAGFLIPYKQANDSATRNLLSVLMFGGVEVYQYANSKSVTEKSRKGRFDNSPAIHRWGQRTNQRRVPSGTTERMATVASAVPSGTAPAFRPLPSDESLGYFQDVPFGTRTFQTRSKKLQRGQPQGDYVIPMAQPYGAFAKALLDPQRYPDLRDKSGNPTAPYDVTAHDLAALMGVDVKDVVSELPSHAPLNKYKNPFSFYTPCSTYAPCLGNKRVVIYKSHVPSMDEGWTRWVVKNHVVPFEESSSLEDKEARAGNLRAKYDTIIIPDHNPRAILEGHKQGTMPEEYTGGLGAEGVKSLREFVESGGTLITFNRTSRFAVEHFNLPLRDITENLARTDFYCPGSILSLELDTAHPIAAGMPRDSIAWFENSPAFEIAQDAPNVRVIARYPANKNPLRSGWLLGERTLHGKAALVEVKLGTGRIILFGFRPQYRGQSLATYPLLFNALN